MHEIARWCAERLALVPIVFLALLVVSIRERK